MTTKLFYRAILLIVGTLFLCLNKGHAQEQFVGTSLIASTSVYDDGFLIYDVKTHQKRFLSFGAGTHLFGDFSPDGCQIVFTWEHTPGNYDLFAARLDGSNLRQMMFIGRTGALSYRVWEPTWSPDGRRIVFTLIRYYKPQDEEPRRDTHVAWVSAEGDGSLNFYSNSGKEWQPRWSPDGQFLAYVSEQPVINEDSPTPESTDDLPTKPEIWVVSADGQNKHRLTDFADGAAYNPRWSPDSRQIAFVYEPSENNHYLMVIAADGTSPFALHQGFLTVLDITWQPSGQGVTAALQGFQDVPENILWDISLNREASRPITDETMTYTDYPRYSPNAEWLAFRRAYDLVIYNTQDHSLQVFDEQAQHNSPPVWSPGGFQGEQNCPD